MASSRFHLEILTPGKRLVETEVSEVVLPAHDGEVGVLAGHEDFIGVLGTGTLKYVENGNDYWLMISSGIFEVQSGKLTILAELGETADSLDPKQSQEKADSLEAELGKGNWYTEELRAILRQYDLEKARLEVHRRTNVVN